MEEWIIDIMQSMGEWGFFVILLLMAAENIFPPIPSEIVLSCAGFLTTCTSLTPLRAIVSATLGSLLGAVVLYGLGRKCPLSFLQKLGFEEKDLERAGKWFRKRGKFSVFFCRCVPILRSIISVPAGAAKMPMRSFLPLTLAGTVLWDAALIFLGAAAGASWRLAAGKLHYKIAVWTMIVFSVAVAVLPFVLAKRRKSKKKAS